MMETTTATKERPILFSGPMVRAILEGRKSQTRRVVKPQPIPVDELCGDEECHDCGDQYFVENGMVRRDEHFGSSVVPCPYGVPGDRLWVRETFAIVPDYDILDDGAGTRIPCGDRVAYRADGNVDVEYEGVAWRPSIFMPRDLSRLTLELTTVRVERLRSDISLEDVVAEGFPDLIEGGLGITEHFDQFARTWDRLNAARGFAYDVDPWVWVIEFKPLTTPTPTETTP